MLLAFQMWIIPYLIIERVKPIIKPKGYACPVVKRYASKRSRHPI
nr:MAG TPA: tumor necrosis factor receptor superfamily member 19 [Caudoviricetes sp.]